MARQQLQTLTEPMYYILLALTQECCGVDIMDRVKTLSHGRISVGPGTLYALLAKFVEIGLIRPTDFHSRRKSYMITDQGREELNREYDRLKTMVLDGQQFINSSR